MSELAITVAKNSVSARRWASVTQYHMVALLCALALSACETGNVSGGGTLDADRLWRQAEATSNSTRQNSLRLSAAEQLIEQANYERARLILEQLDMPANLETLSRSQTQLLTRLLSRTLSAVGDYAGAQQRLGQLTQWQPADFLLLAEACAALEQHQCAADAFIEASLEAGFDDTQLPADLHDQIWANLSEAKSGPAVFTHRYHHAWWLLQQRLRLAGSVTGQIQQWQAWRREYPSHPANIRPPAALLKLNDYQAPSVALLLPMSGPYAAAGMAARDGFVAAYLSDSDNQPPPVKLYDTGAKDLAQIWEQVLDDNPDVIVGPLIKQQVDRFANISAFTDKPRLLLNYLSVAQDPIEAEMDPVYQFGIAIEDEAASLVGYLIDAGHEKVLVVHSQESWARRALSEYTRQWPYPIAEADFVDSKQLTEAVGDAMQIGASQQRRREIANILGQSVEFAPRARQDLEAVVALTSHVESQSLVPALRYHFADQLPIYATSQSARGSDLAALRRFTLTEMPLFTEPGQFANIHQAFSLAGNPFAELYALGYDAFQLATWLPILNHQDAVVLPAASGLLVLQSDGHFRRELNLGQVQADGSITPPALP